MGTRSALAIDLDNITIHRGRALPPEEVAPLLRGVLRLAGSVEYVMLAAPITTIQRYGSTLAALGLPWTIVPALPDAADYALLLGIFELLPLGYSQFVVASADHAFAPVAENFATTVIVRRGQPISRRLGSAATAVLAA